MSNFQLADASAVAKWSAKYAAEYVRETPFKPYMSTKDDAVIRIRTELSDASGSAVHMPYVQRLQGAGVTGDTTLYGSEEALRNYSCVVKTSLRRNAVAIPESQTFKTNLDIADAGRYTLKNWSAEKLRDDLIGAGSQLVVPGAADTSGSYVEDTYAPFALGAVANTHVTNNADRVLFGQKNSNLVSGNMTASLANVGTSDKLGAQMINLMKLKAQTLSNFKINPIKIDNSAGREWYVLFVGPEGYRDLSNDATITQANIYARDRGLGDNPIFQGGDLIYNGVIIRYVPEMPAIGTVGASSARVSQSYLCGTNAMALAWSKMPTPRVQQFDYGHMNNVAIMEIRGQNKFSVAGVQTGMLSVFHAATLDA